MRFMLLIYDRESEWEAMSEAERHAMYEEYLDFTHALRRSWNFVAGEPFQPAHAAVTVRVREGKAVAEPGPSVATEEQLGGFYLIDAESLEEAVAIAERIPSARIGSIEVRPVQEMG